MKTKMKPEKNNIRKITTNVTTTRKKSKKQNKFSATYNKVKESIKKERCKKKKK